MNTLNDVLAVGGTAALAIVVKATIVLLMIWLASLALRHASAAVRHLVWLVGIVGLLLLPMVSRVAEVRVPILPSAAPVTDQAVNMSTATAVGAAPAVTASSHAEDPAPVPATGIVQTSDGARTPPGSGIVSQPVIVHDRALSGGPTKLLSHPAALLVSLWLGVALAVIAWLLTGVFAVRRILRGSRALTADDWMTPLREIADRLDLSDVPRLVMSDGVELAFVCDLRHPTVVLPTSAEGWGADLRRAVLLHELAHVRRRDLAGHALARLTCAVYWFHPLVWEAAHRLRVESERACDDIVLNCGTRASDYAQQLLTMVTSVRHDGAPAVALAMARRKEIEGRMLAILDPGLPRLAVGRAKSFAVIVPFALLVLCIAAIAPARQAALLTREIEPAATTVPTPPTAIGVVSTSMAPAPVVEQRVHTTPVDTSSSTRSAVVDGPVRDRTLGAPTAVGDEAFAEIAAVRELSDGRLIVAQTGPPGAALTAMLAQFATGRVGRGRGNAPDSNAAAKVVLLDAKLKNAARVGQVGADPTQYQNPMGLLALLRDTTLIGDEMNAVLLVVDPKGSVIGTRSVPALGAMGAALIRGATIDPVGRLLYQAPNSPITRVAADGMHMMTPDSAAIMALDFKTGSTAPVAYVRTEGSTAIISGMPGQPGTTMHTKDIPFPILDDWVVMADGSLAVIRGTDMHVNWIETNGKHRSTPPLPFVRIPVTDADTAKYLNGKRRQNTDTMMKRMMSATVAGGMTANPPDSFPAFKPPFTERQAKAASDGTIWLPSQILSPSAPAGYDVIDKNGRLTERVHLMAGQKLIGFGKGVVYVSFRDSNRVVRVGRVPLH